MVVGVEEGAQAPLPIVDADEGGVLWRLGAGEAAPPSLPRAV